MEFPSLLREELLLRLREITSEQNWRALFRHAGHHAGSLSALARVLINVSEFEKKTFSLASGKFL